MRKLNAYKLLPLGDNAITVQFGTEINLANHLKVRQLCTHLDRHPIKGMIEYIPTYNSVTIFYDLIALNNSHKNKQLPYEIIEQTLKDILRNLTGELIKNQTQVEIPVCYDAEFSPDLKFVADHHRISQKEVIRIHTAKIYYVYMLGFSPGFPFLGGLCKNIATPRKESPMLAIPAGSVGIAGCQTGIYPIQSPGGWQIIGRTPSKLFQPENESPTLLKTGDTITFKPISADEFHTLEATDI